MKHKRVTAVVTAVVGAAFLLTSCSAPEGAESESSGDFDASVFPESTFGDLKAPLTWYDSSGGLTTDSKNETVWKNFSELTGVDVREEFTDGTITKFIAGAQSGNVPWNLLEVGTGAEFYQIHDMDVLEPIDTSIVPVDKLDPASVDDYGIKVEENGAVLTWNTEALGGKTPTSAADIYNVDEFPGKRCLYKYPVSGGVLESALYADGVAPEDIYPIDVDRALAKLDTIKDDVVWWDSAATAIQLLNNGECSMAMMWTGRVYDAIEQQGLPLDFTWKGGTSTAAYFAVPKGLSDDDKATGFAAMAMWILDEQGQINFVNKTTYATAINDLALSDYDPSVQPYLATGENLDGVIVEDSKAVAEQLDELNDKMNAFLAS